MLTKKVNTYAKFISLTKKAQVTTILKPFASVQRKQRAKSTKFIQTDNIKIGQINAPEKHLKEYYAEYADFDFKNMWVLEQKHENPIMDASLFPKSSAKSAGQMC